MKTKRTIFAFSIFIFLTANSFAQSGGTFAITQSAIAGGGGQNSSGGAFSLDGTIGQTVAGNALRGNPFAVSSGFWNFTPAAPTAAQVSISGRALTSTGIGIRNVLIRLTDAAGTSRLTTTATFGYFHFNEVNAGQTYLITAQAKRFEFSQPAQVLSVSGNVSELNFIANPK